MMNQDLALKNQSRAFVAMTILRQPIVQKEPLSETSVLIRMTVTNQLVGWGNPPPLVNQADTGNGEWLIRPLLWLHREKTSILALHVTKRSIANNIWCVATLFFSIHALPRTPKSHAIIVLVNFGRTIGWENALNVENLVTSAADGIYASIALQISTKQKCKGSCCNPSPCGHGWWDGATLPRHVQSEAK